MSEKEKIDFENICDKCINETVSPDTLDHFLNKMSDNVFEVKNIENFCSKKQKEGNCEAMKVFEKKVIGGLKGKKKKDVEFCQKCCLGHDVEVSSDFMKEVANANDKSFGCSCPLHKKIFESKDVRDEECENKLLKVMEGAL